MPYQPEPIGEIEWQKAHISGDESFYLRAARKLHQSEALIPAWRDGINRLDAPFAYATQVKDRRFTGSTGPPKRLISRSTP